MSGKKPDCGCLFPMLPCWYSLNLDEFDVGRRQHSTEIDKQLALERKSYEKTHRLLLLGAGESGKSTIIKQMQLLHVLNFTDAFRIQKRADIRANLLEAISSILASMGTISPPVEFENSENEMYAKWILDNGLKPDFDFPLEFYNYTEILWRDRGVQETFRRSNEYQLIDNAKHFLDKSTLISEDNYLPSDQDILRCRILTTGIYELNFQVKGVKFRMIDVGGQRGERRKWFLCFNDVTAIIFVTACSSYDMVLREDSSKNRLQESIDLFKIVWNNRWLCRVPVILFLNKQDIFEEKILSGRRKLENYFPSYKNYTLTSKELKDLSEPFELSRAKNFIKDQFKKISLNTNKPGALDHVLFPHFTCAVNTENIQRVFEDCRDAIQRRNLIRHDLM